MPSICLEHINVTLSDLDRATQVLQAIVPHWRVRGAGVAVDDAGRDQAWRHVGDDLQYLALFQALPGDAPAAAPAQAAFNHLALVVDDLDATLARLQALDVHLHHPGGGGAWRRSAYVRLAPEQLEIELVAYDSTEPARRNVYAMPA